MLLIDLDYVSYYGNLVVLSFLLMLLHLCNDFSVLNRFRNCGCYYYYCVVSL